VVYRYEQNGGLTVARQLMTFQKMDHMIPY